MVIQIPYMNSPMMNPEIRLSLTCINDWRYQTTFFNWCPFGNHYMQCRKWKSLKPSCLCWKHNYFFLFL